MRKNILLLFTVSLLTLALHGCNSAKESAIQTEPLHATTVPVATPEAVPTTAPAPTPAAVPTTAPDTVPATVPDSAPAEFCLPQNPFNTLSVPTQITKIEEDYFLVDCYHNQILVSSSLDKPLEEWHVMTDLINRGHTIAGNGTVYLADDTENNRVLVFRKTDNGFSLTQTFDNIGNRPHYVEYDPDTALFYVLSSMSGELYIFGQENASAPVSLIKTMVISDMQDVYIRSFTLDGDEIYFAASNGTILRAALSDLEILERWTLPDELAGLVQVVKVQDYFYLTVSTDKSGNAECAAIIRTKDLSYLQEYGYDDLYAEFAGEGTPYYISAFDGHYYLTQHYKVPGHGVWQFDLEEDALTNIQILFP